MKKRVNVFDVLTIGDMKFKGYILRDSERHGGTMIRQIVFIDIPFKRNIQYNRKNRYLYEFILRCVMALFPDFGINSVFSHKGKMTIGFVIPYEEGEDGRDS